MHHIGIKELFAFGEAQFHWSQSFEISHRKPSQSLECFSLLRSRSRSPRRRAHSPERRRDERSVPTAYRISNSPGNSRKRPRSRWGGSEQPAACRLLSWSLTVVSFVCSGDLIEKEVFGRKKIWTHLLFFPVLAYVWTAAVQSSWWMLIRCCLLAMRVQIALGVLYFPLLGHFLMLWLGKLYDLCTGHSTTVMSAFLTSHHICIRAALIWQTVI